MFTYIKAKNFKSLKDINFNLKKTQNEINKLIVIYGENGSGKTNIVETLKFLQQSTLAKVNEYFFKDILDEFHMATNKPSYEMLENIVGTANIRFKINSYRTIDEEEPTELEYGFQIDGIEGVYYIKFTDTIQEEKLYYLVEKQRGYFYEISKNEDEIIKKINKKIFKNDDYKKEIEDNIDKYWGKCTLLSLINLEAVNKNWDYLEKNISKNLLNVIAEFSTFLVHVENAAPRTIITENFHVRDDINGFGKGKLATKDVDQLKKYEKILKSFFTQAYSDIKDVKYEITEKEEEAYYELMFVKQIGNKTREIAYSQESEGTKRIVNQLDTLIGALEEKTVIIDEVDNGIHDLLIKNIIMSIKDEINGQLIITTHNTLLLETLPKECIYILTSDYQGNKQINSVREYDIKVQKNNNPRDLYLKGAFGGIPLSDYIDFEVIKYILNQEEEKKLEQ